MNKREQHWCRPWLGIARCRFPFVRLSEVAVGFGLCAAGIVLEFLRLAVFIHGALARYKEREKHKIELFYFLAYHWFRRAIAAIRKDETIQAWWGRDDWRKLRTMQPTDVLNEIEHRLKKELRYRSLKPRPIFSRKHGGRIMYYMVHATDHTDAPAQMSRAYELAVQREQTAQQLNLGLEAGGPAHGA